MDPYWSYGERKQKRAEALLLETRREFTLLLNTTEDERIVEAIIEEMPTEEPVPVDQGPLFSVFMLQWLAMMKHQVEFITYASYHNVITNHVVPYFEEKGLFLKQLLPCHIQDYYQYELEKMELQPTRFYIITLIFAKR